MRQNRHQHGGGLAIYFKNNIQVTELDIKTDQLETCGLNDTIIITAYNPTSKNNTDLRILPKH